MSKENRAELESCCVEMAQLHERLFRVGLLKTAQKMKPAADQIGYEAAEIVFEQLAKGE